MAVEEGTKPKVQETLLIVERAKSGRSSCKNCKEKIEKDTIRVGVLSFVSGMIAMGWSHPKCFAEKLEVGVHEKGQGMCKFTKVKLEKGDLKTTVRSGCSTKFFLSLEGVQHTTLRAAVEASGIDFTDLPCLGDLPKDKTDEWISALQQGEALSDIVSEDEAVEKATKKRPRKSKDEEEDEEDREDDNEDRDKDQEKSERQKSTTSSAKNPPAKKQKAAKKEVVVEEEEEKEEEEEEEKKRKKKNDTASAKPPAKVVDNMPKTYSKEDYPDPLSEGDIKIVSYNVNGLASCVKNGMESYVRAENADILCLQETKLQEANTGAYEELAAEWGYGYRYFSCSRTKKGYAGTAVFSKIEPKSVTYGLHPNGNLNEEGRTITAEFTTFTIVNTYVPNSGQKLERLDWREKVWDVQMLQHLKSLSGDNDKHSIIFIGDLNVAHEEIDLTNFKQARNKTAGFCDQERLGLSNILAHGFDDTFRRLHPEEVVYTFWGMRSGGYNKNVGWRLDYFIASRCLREKISETFTRKKVYGASDHVPIGLIMTK